MDHLLMVWPRRMPEVVSTLPVFFGPKHTSLKVVSVHKWRFIKFGFG